jgi:pyruvate dehydrogenase E2 component (dihydrolipoamide acetyltransferase)
METPQEGVLARIVSAEGSVVAVGTLIAYIGAEGEAVIEKPPEAAAPKVAPAPTPVISQASQPQAASAPAEAAPARVIISPAARKLAEEKGVDWSRLKGSGPGGRIVTGDVEKAALSAPAAPTAHAAAKPAADDALPALDVTSDEADVEETPFRAKAMIRRVVAAKQFIPHFYMTAGVDVTALMGRAEALKASHGAGLTHMIMLACVKALALRPEINRSYDRGRTIKWKHVNLGLAVDTKDGLTVGVIPRSETLSLKALVQQTQALVAAARGGELSVEQRRHATFTISNLGMFGVEDFSAIINPPSSITMAVSAALDKPVVRGGQVRVGKVMNLTISCDHRVVDGAPAAKFLKDLKTLLEDPDRLLAGQ